MMRGRDQLRQVEAAAKLRYERQVTLVGQVRGRDPDSIRGEIFQVRQDLDRTDRELASLTGNLYQHLQRELGETQLAAVNRLFAKEVMIQGEGRFKVDGALLRPTLEHWLRDPEYVELPGLLQDARHHPGDALRIGDVHPQGDRLRPKLRADPFQRVLVTVDKHDTRALRDQSSGAFETDARCSPRDCGHFPR